MAPRAREQPVRILLVDDHIPNLVALEAVLEPLGQELVLARSGREALEKLAENPCALVLMDVHMPVLDGFQTVEAIRKRQELQHLPVMFLTAMFKDKDSVARGYSLGAVDFITKPFEPAIIRAKVGAFVVLHQHNESIKRHEIQLAEEVAARKQAELAALAREEFMAILGHDLRSPLMAIASAAEQHADAAHASATCREASARITRATHRMTRLIEDILDLARGRLGGGIPVERKRVDLTQLCRVPIDELQLAYPTRTISFRAQGDASGEWDPDRMIQVVANLVGNAIKHGGNDVEVLLHGDEPIVKLQVHNDAAIPASRMQHLFEPFQRGDRQRDGLGLGLYIVDQIVRAHGGNVAAESSQTSGTTFTVTLPRNAAS